MKRSFATLAIVLIASLSIVGCSNQTLGTAAGGVAGGGLGYAVSGGNAVATGVGAVGGAVVGNALSR